MKKQLILILWIFIIKCYSVPLDRIREESDYDFTTTILPSVDRENYNENYKDELVPLINFEETTESNVELPDLSREKILYTKNIAEIHELPYNDAEESVETIVEKASTGSEFTTESSFPIAKTSSPRDDIPNLVKQKSDVKVVKTLQVTLPPVQPSSYFVDFAKNRGALKNDDWSSEAREEEMLYDDWNNYFCTEKIMRKQKAEQVQKKKDTIPKYEKEFLYRDRDVLVDRSITKRESIKYGHDFVRSVMVEPAPDRIELFGSHDLIGEEQLMSKNARNPSPFENVMEEPILMDDYDGSQQLPEKKIKNVNLASTTKVQKTQSKTSTEKPSTNPKKSNAPPTQKARPTAKPSADSNSQDKTSSGHTTKMPSTLPMTLEKIRPSPKPNIVNRKTTNSPQVKNHKEMSVSNSNRGNFQPKFNSKKSESHTDYSSMKNPKEIPPSKILRAFNTPRTIDLSKLGLEMQPKMYNSKNIQMNSEAFSIEDPREIMPPPSANIKIVNTPRTIDLSNFGLETHPRRFNNFRDLPRPKNSNQYNLLPTADYNKMELPMYQNSRMKDAMLRKDVSTTRSIPFQTQRANGKRSTSDDGEEEKNASSIEQLEMEPIKVEDTQQSESTEDEEDNDSADNQNHRNHPSDTNGFDISNMLARGVGNLLSFYLFVRRTSSGLLGIVNRIFGS